MTFQHPDMMACRHAGMFLGTKKHPSHRSESGLEMAIEQRFTGPVIRLAILKVGMVPESGLVEDAPDKC